MRDPKRWLTALTLVLAVSLLPMEANDASAQSSAYKTATTRWRAAADGFDGWSLSGLGIGRDVVLDRVIVDKNARIGDGVRLTNAAGVSEADGDGYCIRNGIIIVPKGAVVKPGTAV